MRSAMPTEFLSVARQLELIAAAQTAPVELTVSEDGTETLRYGANTASEAALDELVRAFLPVIGKEARRSKRLDFEEAEAVLLAEFVATVRLHDLSSPVPFSKTIGTILSRKISDTDRTSDLVPVKESVAVYYWRLMHRHDGDVAAAYEEVKATANGISPATFLSVHAIVSGVDSIDVSAGERDVTATAAAHEYAFGGSFEDRVALRAEVDWLFTLVGDRAETILRLVYGFADSATETIRLAHGFRIGEELTDSQAAHVLSLTRPTAQRERVKALALMRAAIEQLEQLEA